MKVEISDIKEVKEVNWKQFKIFEGHKNTRLIIDGPEFRVMILEDRVYIKYIFHRPDHDHNNSPAVKIDIPRGGARRGDNVTLTVEASSGFCPDMFIDWGYGKPQELEPVRNGVKK